PAIRPSTLMSSSISGQCIPSPRPMNRHALRSLLEAFTSRGNHASGTEIDRPSLRSTVNVSSLTATSDAVGTLTSIAEELIPCLQQFLAVIGDQPFDPANLSRAETAVF